MSYKTHSANLQKVDPAAPFGLHAHLQRVRECRARGEVKAVVGSWTMLPGSNLARLIASQGWDFVLIDAEHGNIDDASMHSQVAAVGNTPGCSPIVRVPAPEGWLIKRALDTGAHGLMCPMMNTAADAKLLVSNCHFPPRSTQSGANGIPGVRGAGSPFSPALWKRTLQEYLDTANKGVFLIVQIETREGLENCEEIAAVQGIDMLFIGPNDLANSMGYTATEHESIPEVQAAIERIKKAAHDNGKYAGMFCTQSDQVLKRAEQGFELMNCGFDVMSVLGWNETALKAMEALR